MIFKTSDIKYFYFDNCFIKLRVKLHQLEKNDIIYSIGYILILDIHIYIYNKKSCLKPFVLGTEII